MDKVLQWAVNGKTYSLCERTETTLPPGVYTPQMGFMGPMLMKQEILTDKLLSLDGCVSGQVIASVEKFAANKAKYERFGMIHKRGILMYGKPGVGKTGTIWLTANTMVEKFGACVLLVAFNHPSQIGMLKTGLRMVRENCPDMPIVVVTEDLDRLRGFEQSYPGITKQLENLLDGDEQVGNVIYLATTNFIDRLPATITNRPSRFDEVIEVLPPTALGRYNYFRMFVTEEDVPEATMESWVGLTSGFNIAHMKEFLLSVMVLEVDPKTTANRLAKMSGDALNREEYKQSKKRQAYLNPFVTQQPAYALEDVIGENN